MLVLRGQPDGVTFQLVWNRAKLAGHSGTSPVWTQTWIFQVEPEEESRNETATVKMPSDGATAAAGGHKGTFRGACRSAEEHDDPERPTAAPC